MASDDRLKTRKSHTMRDVPRGEMVGFDVVMEQTIGFVEFDTGGAQSPIEAAFTIIGTRISNDHESGTFRFPDRDGGFITVDVGVPEVERPINR